MNHRQHIIKFSINKYIYLFIYLYKLNVYLHFMSNQKTKFYLIRVGSSLKFWNTRPLFHSFEDIFFLKQKGLNF